LQNLVQDRLQKHLHSPVALEQLLLDLLIFDLDLKSSRRRSAFGCWSGALTTWQNAMAFSIQPGQLYNYRDTT
jgi:hypothetical protein